MKPHPFEYPDTPHKRRHGPQGWQDYRRYRSWLRDEFSFRCVYCLMRERWMDMRRANPIDHFLPKSIRPDLSSTYDNLLYLCANCNGLKSDSLLPNPCAIALGNYLQVQADGAVIARDGSIEGECLIDELALNHRDFSDFRRRLMRMLEIAAKYDREQFVDWMKYPDDLPDLSLEKPDSNSRPDGVARSYYMARKHRFLPDVY